MRLARRTFLVTVISLLSLRRTLSANVSETATPWKFRVDGESGSESDEPSLRGLDQSPQTTAALADVIGPAAAAVGAACSRGGVRLACRRSLRCGR